MTGFVTKNNSKGLLQAAIAPGAVSTTLQGGHTMPALAADEYSFGTFISSSNSLEVVKISAISGNTVAHSAVTGNYAAGDRLELRPCKEMLQALAQEAAVEATVVLSGTNNYTGTPAPGITQLAGVAWYLKFPNANSLTAVNVNLSGLGNKAVKDRDGVVPAVGAIKAGSQHVALYDGTQFILLSLSQTIVNPPAVQIRQSVQCGSVDTNGLANWLTAGTGLQVNLTATAAAVALAFAAGFTSFGASDLVTQLTADAVSQFAALPANNTSFLAADYVSATAFTGSNTLTPPQYGNAFDRTRASLLHFDGANGQGTTTDDWGNTWTLTGATLSTSAPKFGATALSCNGTGQYASSTSFNSLGGGSWCLEGQFRIGTLPTSGNTMAFVNLGGASYRPLLLGLFNNAGTFKTALYMSSNGSTDDIVSAGLGTTTTGWVVNTYRHIALVFDALAGKYFLYVDGVLDQTITSTARLANFTTFYWGHNVATGGFVDFNGMIDECRFSPFCPYPNGTAFTAPVAAFTVNQAGQLACWFDIPNMLMREVTTASAVGGTNPTFTTRSRLFVGEADTGAATVSAVRSYAYRGQYRSPTTPTFPAGGVPTTFNHNIGIPPSAFFSKPRLYGVCLATDSGYLPGETYEPSAAAGSLPITVCSNTSRNVAVAQAGANGTGWFLNAKPGGGSANLTIANWAYFLCLERGW